MEDSKGKECEKQVNEGNQRKSRHVEQTERELRQAHKLSQMESGFPGIH